MNIAAMLCGVALLLSGCAAPANASAAESPLSAASSGAAAPSASASSWTPGKPVYSAFHEAEADGENGVLLDLSAVSDGVAAVSAESESRLKFQVVFGEKKYNYDLPNDGTPLIVPIQESGDYVFRALQNTTGTKYVEIFSKDCAVQLSSAFAPFLRSSSMVRYAAGDRAVKEAASLAANVTSDAAFVSAVYAYLKENVAYDYELAESNPTMYYPDPVATLESGKGICFDYAAAAAAMLRSCGVPAKLVTGYVTEGDVYHAWNMIYLEERGWITMEISAEGGEWQVIDVTLAATGEDEPLPGNAYRELDEY